MADPHPGDPSPAPTELVSLADYERAAQARLDPQVFGYFAGGAADEITLRDNVASWQRLAIRPRVLVGVAERDPTVTLLGRPRPHPLIVAPMAFHALAHPDAEIGTARAAAITGSIMCLSTFSTTTIPSLADAAPDATRWFGLYVVSDRGIGRELVAQAAAHGYEALVVTVDRPVLGYRERDVRLAVLPPSERLAPGGLTPEAGQAMSVHDAAARIDPSLTWTDIEHFAADSSLPVLVKGIVTAEDARLAAEHGAAGVVVSNHGGRQLDTVPAAADVLPEVVDAVGDRLEVIVDGGIRRGTDVLKALALGARAVMIGRPVLWGLALGGTAGAARVLEILLAEFDVALALSGAPRAAELDGRFIVPAKWVGD